MKLQPETIVEESQREAIVNRPHNLAGSVQRVKKERFKITSENVELSETNIVPAVLKLFQEALDNPIDVAIKSQFACANKINIKVTSDSISVEDNGYGISSDQDANGEYILYKAMCKYNTSSNYADANEGQKGVNGIGIKLCTTLSTHFEAISDDGIKKIKVIAKNNNFEHEVFEYKTKEAGTSIMFKPDFKIFEIDSIDQEHIDRMYEYVLIQALTYPSIEFKFNGKSVKYTPKKFLSLFGKESLLTETDNYFFAIMSNDTDDFKHVSFVNGLETARGGSHINYVMDNVVARVRETLIKKYKTIKPADIKNRLQLVLIAKNLKGAKWDGQTKESITNPPKDMSEYFSEIDFEALSKKFLKTPSIVDPITEVYKLKEELQKRKDMKALDGKPKEKIKSDKYNKPVGENNMLVVCEGQSAKNGLLPSLGRNGIAFYELRGKPMNSLVAPQSKFTQNKELSELYKIIKQEGFKKILFAADADLDGSSIMGLLMAFSYKYINDTIENGHCYILRTPIASQMKNKKPFKWVYSYGEIHTLGDKDVKFYKGYGSWKPEDLKYVISVDGLDRMLEPIEYTKERDEQTILDWYMPENTDYRKEMIKYNDFDLIKI